jgi:hypothetical protein
VHKRAHEQSQSENQISHLGNLGKRSLCGCVSLRCLKEVGLMWKVAIRQMKQGSCAFARVSVREKRMQPMVTSNLHKCARFLCTAPATSPGTKIDACGEVDDDDDTDWEEMIIPGPAGNEWGGPTRGGIHAEPTRFGDWERKGRCSDF